MTEDVRDPAAPIDGPIDGPMDGPTDADEPRAPWWERLAGGDPKRVVVPGLAAATVFGIALAILFAVLWQRSEPTAEETRADVGRFLAANEAAVADTSTEVLTLLLNYDSTTLDEVADHMLEVSTGRFKNQYEEFVQAGFAGALEEVAASSRGEILGEPEVSFTSVSEATVIARVEQITQSTGNPQGKTFTYVLQLTLIDTRDGWKADEVRILSGEG